MQFAVKDPSIRTITMGTNESNIQQIRLQPKSISNPDDSVGFYSASHFSPFFAYLSSSIDKSRMTNVRTTLAKNSEERLSFGSRAMQISVGREA